VHFRFQSHFLPNGILIEYRKAIKWPLYVSVSGAVVDYASTPDELYSIQ